MHRLLPRGLSLSYLSRFRERTISTLFEKAGLRFQDPSEERRFIDQFTKGNIGWTQVAMLLGALTYVGYTIWDWVLYPEIVPATFAIRGGVAAFVLLPLTALLSTPLKRYAEAIYVVYCVVPGCVLTFIYWIIPSGFVHAAAGMIIVILFVSTLLPLRLKSLLIFCVLTWICLIVSEMNGPALEPGLLFINQFEIGTAYLLSLWAVGAREYQARKRFVTAEELLREKEKSEASLIELRAAQATLIQAEKLAWLGQIVAGVAHEVSTPLGSALTTTTALEADVKALEDVLAGGQVKRSDLTRSTDRLKQGLAIASSSMLRAHELVHSFKQVAIDQSQEDRQTIKFQPWLDDLAENLRPLLARRNLRFSVSCPMGLALESYPGPLSQVLSNLAFNAAVHAYPNGGGGIFRVEVTQPSPVNICIECSDDGVGIPPEVRHRIFDPFFTTRRDRGSTGLGLHIVFNVVSSVLRGTVRLDETFQQGTRIIINLPTALKE